MLKLDKNKDYFGLPVHPVCNIFPLLNPLDLENLQDDIEKYGLNHPLVVYEGQLVDGRNRANACLNLGIIPPLSEWRSIYKGPQSIDDWIWAENVERRHLTDDQRLAVQVQFNAYKEQRAAKQRQVDAGKQFHKGSAKVVTNSSQASLEATVAETSDAPEPAPEVKAEPAPVPRAPAVRVQIAQQLHVSEYKVQQALNVLKADPELLKQVTNKKLTLKEAAKAVAKPASGRRRRSNEPKDVMDRALEFLGGWSMGAKASDIASAVNACDREELRRWLELTAEATRIIRKIRQAILRRQKSSGESRKDLSNQ